MHNDRFWNDLDPNKQKYKCMVFWECFKKKVNKLILGTGETECMNRGIIWTGIVTAGFYCSPFQKAWHVR